MFSYLKLDFVTEMNNATKYQLHSKKISSFHPMNNVLSIKKTFALF